MCKPWQPKNNKVQHIRTISEDKLYSGSLPPVPSTPSNTSRLPFREATFYKMPTLKQLCIASLFAIGILCANTTEPATTASAATLKNPLGGFTMPHGAASAATNSSGPAINATSIPSNTTSQAKSVKSTVFITLTSTTTIIPTVPDTISMNHGGGSAAVNSSSLAINATFTTSQAKPLKSTVFITLKSTTTITPTVLETSSMNQTSVAGPSMPMMTSNGTLVPESGGCHNGKTFPPIPPLLTRIR
ncbi:unnamed protein product [Periconia digitata]|uniref:Uncharacterized protein n=1 Tax=Periconia digitata TaxID=1303443 RepID=A0A9W4UFI0_9PLEO|nr:unnamed protein product [Periconia digitata]